MSLVEGVGKVDPGKSLPNDGIMMLVASYSAESVRCPRARKVSIWEGGILCVQAALMPALTNVSKPETRMTIAFPSSSERLLEASTRPDAPGGLVGVNHEEPDRAGSRLRHGNRDMLGGGGAVPATGSGYARR